MDCSWSRATDSFTLALLTAKFFTSEKGGEKCSQKASERLGYPKTNPEQGLESKSYLRPVPQITLES